jgi:hypothetical protein
LSDTQAGPRKVVMFARGRLKEARTWFAHKGRSVLPHNERGERIVQWVADHAWIGYPANPEANIRRICRPLAPWLSDSQLDDLIKATNTSTKNWSHDQCAAVLEITVADCLAQGFRFLGAADDPEYQTRQEARRVKKAASARKRRAAKSTGRKRGRPKLALTPEEMQARSNAQAAERMRKFRLRKNASPDKIKKTGPATDLIVTDAGPPIILKSPPIVPARAPQSAPRPDELIDDGGCALAAPPHERSRRGSSRIISTRSAT